MHRNHWRSAIFNAKLSEYKADFVQLEYLSSSSIQNTKNF